MTALTADERISQVQENAPNVEARELVAEVSRYGSLAAGFYLAARGGWVAAATFGAAVGGGYVGAWIAEKTGAPQALANALDFFGMHRIGEVGPEGPHPAGLGHQVAHSYAFAGFLASVAIGVAVGLAVVATGGTAAAVIIGAAAAGGLTTGFLGATLTGALSRFGSQTGPIVSASANVFVGGRAAATMTDMAACAKESAPPPIVEGCATIYINNLPMARVGDKLICGAVIDEGVTSICVDRTTEACATPLPEVPVWARVVSDWVGFLSLGRLSARLLQQKPSSARNILQTALDRQGLKSPPKAFKEKWSKDGYDYEVRIHPADPSHNKSGSIYRVGRRQQGTDAQGQGFGWEYIDDGGAWHPKSTLKPGKPGNPNPTFNPEAAERTHIQLP